MNTPLRRIIAVAGLLAAIAYLIVMSARTNRESRISTPAQESPPKPGATPSNVSPSQPTPDLPVATAPVERPASPSTAPSTDVASKPPPVSQVDAPSASKPPMTAPAVGSVPSAAPPPAPARDADFAAVENDLEHIRMMVREFRDVVGENPMGTNSEIMKAVMGDNLKQVKIGLPDGQSLNGKGELVDRWGTPYFFHQVSKTEMEIRSAGPDRVMWTGDDREQK